jgi:hypothetical protein
MSPIRELLRKDVPFHWGERQDKALEQLKEALLNNAMLIYPNMNEKFYLQSDSSSKAIAHCLLQMKDGVLRPISFGGRALKKHETKMSATDLELVGFLDAILSYKQFISNGKRWTILTDHLCLQYIQNLRHSASPKLFRYSLLLQDLDFDVEHIKGKLNILPDFLSRYPIKEHEGSENPPDPEPDSILDVDHFNF